MSLKERIRVLKLHAGIAAQAQASEARGDWTVACLLWERAAEVGKDINHGDHAREAAVRCRRAGGRQDED
ncbi:hypothetical protein M988_3795 [Hafnia paralvei ATCC 29927]|uniref:hypothetical protein n=1 Tax=Hafnia paralvei TaxID=546367 RepID=UPI0007E32357|nr:hypothetical protein [Hafnia paralvei]OAT37918.1 hypothetical protein M988_3795 [Hafnia paralvei ATCC 29927]